MHRIYLTLPLYCLFISLLGAAACSQTNTDTSSTPALSAETEPQNQPMDFVAGELIVTFSNTQPYTDTIKAINKLPGARFRELIADIGDLKIAVVEVPETQEKQWIEKLQSVSGVKYAELNGVGNFIQQ